MESVRRSVAKAISWRVFASFTTASIAWALTGRLTLAWKIGLLDGLTKLVLYILHERIWARSKYGIPKPPEYEI
jgi:uncharacterized membrane protein